MTVRRRQTRSKQMYERLWAPWRIAYITGVPKRTPSQCLFCFAAHVKNQRDHFVVTRTEHSLAMLNIYPYNNGHIMVAPKRHVSDLCQLTVAEQSDIMNLTIEMQSILKKIMRPEGFNIGINLGDVAGAGIKDHMHVHIVPRWKGDTNFMPVTAHTKVISQSLESLYKLIMNEIRS